MSYTIGEVARAFGMSKNALRYYEEKGILSPAVDPESGYRYYDDASMHRIGSIKKLRNLGFSIDDCRQLMALYQDRSRASADVRRIASDHVTAIEEKIRELQSMRSTLQKLVHACHGDDRPDCPILEDMAGDMHVAGSNRERNRA